MMIASKYGPSVLVQHTISLGDHNLQVIRTLGVSNNVVEQHTVTVGAVDGPRPTPPTVAELQQQLDDARQKVADNAAWKSIVKQNIANLV